MSAESCTDCSSPWTLVVPPVKDSNLVLTVTRWQMGQFWDETWIEIHGLQPRSDGLQHMSPPSSATRDITHPNPLLRCRDQGMQRPEAQGTQPTKTPRSAGCGAESGIIHSQNRHFRTQTSDAVQTSGGFFSGIWIGWPLGRLLWRSFCMCNALFLQNDTDSAG